MAPRYLCHYCSPSFNRASRLLSIQSLYPARGGPVQRDGNTEGSYTVILQIKGVKEAEKSVTVAAGDSQNVSFTVSKETIGSYSAVVNGLSGSFTVIPPPVEPPPVEPTLAESINWLLLGGIIAAYLVVAVWVISAIRRRKRSRLLIPRY